MAPEYSTNLVEGTVDVGSGAYVGTKAYNTPPTISSTLTANVLIPMISTENAPPFVMMISYFGIPLTRQVVPLLRISQLTSEMPP